MELFTLPDPVHQSLTRWALFGLTGAGARRIPVAMFRGKSRGTGRPATAIVAGHDPWVGYIPSKLFADGAERIHLGNVTVWRLDTLLSQLQASADLIVARIDRLSAHLFLRRGYLAVPEWVGARVPVPEDLDRFVARRDGVRSDVALVRRQGLLPLVTEGDEGLDAFYRTMYVPFAENRHGELTFLRTVEDLRRRLRSGGILWISRGSDRLAGLAFQQRGGTLDLLAIGTANGDVALVKEGVIAPAYYYSLDHARRVGCSLLDLRGSRPSLRDGLLRYKAKWGATLYDKSDSYHDLLLRWNGGNEVVEEFFSLNPLIFREGGGYSGVRGDRAQTVRSLWIDGLRRMYQLSPSGQPPLVAL